MLITRGSRLAWFVAKGVISTTGVGGLMLCGGFGRLSRKYGLTADNLLSADIITPDEALLTASADENPDLFWGICGGRRQFRYRHLF